MVLQRKFAKKNYIIAGIITILIFFLGFLLGIIMDNERLQWAKDMKNMQEINFKRIQFQNLYLTMLEDTNESCSVLYVTLEDTIADLDDSLEKLLSWNKESPLNKVEFEIVRQNYLIDNLKYWLFAREMKVKCKLDIVTILYFYSDEKCHNCPDQGVILSHFKKKFNERVLIFPINIDLEKNERTITLIRKRYDINNYPSIVIEDEKFEGVISKAELESHICSAFKNLQPECAAANSNET